MLCRNHTSWCTCTRCWRMKRFEVMLGSPGSGPYVVTQAFQYIFRCLMKLRFLISILCCWLSLHSLLAWSSRRNS